MITAETQLWRRVVAVPTPGSGGRRPSSGVRAVSVPHAFCPVDGCDAGETGKSKGKWVEVACGARERAEQTLPSHVGITFRLPVCAPRNLTCPAALL